MVSAALFTMGKCSRKILKSPLRAATPPWVIEFLERETLAALLFTTCLATQEQGRRLPSMLFKSSFLTKTLNCYNVSSELLRAPFDQPTRPLFLWLSSPMVASSPLHRTSLHVPAEE